MISAQNPTPQVMRDVVTGLISGRYSRTETVAWYQTLEPDMNYRSPYPREDGFRFENAVLEQIFISLSLLELRHEAYGGDGFFIRHQDLQDYLALIDDAYHPYPFKTLMPSELNQKVVNVFATKPSPGFNPDAIGIHFTRMHGEDIPPQVAVTQVRFGNVPMILNLLLTLDHPESFGVLEVMAPSDTDPKLLAEAAYLLKADPQAIWIREAFGGPATDLYRQDDNGNDFHINHFETLIEAWLAMKAYEDLGHKQLYYLK